MKTLINMKKISFAVDNELSQLLNERTPRDMNNSMIYRLFSRALVSTPAELESYFKEHKDEARVSLPILKNALLKLYQISEDQKCDYYEKKPARGRDSINVG